MLVGAVVPVDAFVVVVPVVFPAGVEVAPDTLAALVPVEDATVVVLLPPAEGVQL